MTRLPRFARSTAKTAEFSVRGAVDCDGVEGIAEPTSPCVQQGLILMTKIQSRLTINGVTVVLLGAFVMLCIANAQQQVALTPDDYSVWEDTWLRGEVDELWITDVDATGFSYYVVERVRPNSPNTEVYEEGTALFLGPLAARSQESGDTFVLRIAADDRHDRDITYQDVVYKHLRTTFRAGFDCDKAATAVELAICQNERIAAGDLELNRLYGELLDVLPAERRRSFRSDQRAWLTRRNRDCLDGNDVDVACLTRLYADRLAAIAKLRDPELGAEEQVRSSGEGEAGSAPIPGTGYLGRVVRNHQGDGTVLTHSAFNLDYCGICPRDPNMDWRSDFSNSFLGEGESCSYAPSRLVDGDPQTGWSEGDEGDGVGAEVVVPGLLDLTKPLRIWAGYGKSPELFAANGRPKRVRVTVLRLRAAEPDSHDATGCSDSEYVEPVAVAEHEVALLDFNGYQALPVPDFQVEHYLEYPREWLMMDGHERMMHQERVDAGQAVPFRREATEYAYLLRLTLLEVYPGIRYEDTVISEIGNSPLPSGAGQKGSANPSVEVFQDCPSCPELVVIPAGTYRMGCVSGRDCESDELPVREVRVPSFGLSKYEVTFEEFDCFTDATGRPRVDDEGWGRGRRPVINVSWEDAAEYADWLSAETGERYRLPSESEWEYAARAGASTLYSWGNDPGRNRANCSGCGSGWDDEETAPVGSFDANGWGLHDMHGNV